MAAPTALASQLQLLRTGRSTNISYDDTGAAIIAGENNVALAPHPNRLASLLDFRLDLSTLHRRARQFIKRLAEKEIYAATLEYRLFGDSPVVLESDSESESESESIQSEKRAVWPLFPASANGTYRTRDSLTLGEWNMARQVIRDSLLACMPALSGNGDTEDVTDGICLLELMNRCYQTISRHADDVLLPMLPLHATPLYSRLLKVAGTDGLSMTSRWFRWCAPAAAVGAGITRTSIAQRIRADIGFYTAIASIGVKTFTKHKKNIAAQQLHVGLLLSLHAALIQGVDSGAILPEALVQAITATSSRALTIKRHGCTAYYHCGLATVILLASKHLLTDNASTGIANLIVKHCDGAVWSSVALRAPIAALAILFKHYPKQVTLTTEQLHYILAWPNAANAIDYVCKSYDAHDLVASLLLCIASEYNSSSGARSLLKQLIMTDGVLASHIGSLVDALLLHASDIDENLLNDVDGDSSMSNGMLDKLAETIRLLDAVYSTETEKAIHRYTFSLTAMSQKSPKRAALLKRILGFCLSGSRNALIDRNGLTSLSVALASDRDDMAMNALDNLSSIAIDGDAPLPHVHSELLAVFQSDRTNLIIKALQLKQLHLLLGDATLWSIAEHLLNRYVPIIVHTASVQDLNSMQLKYDSDHHICRIIVFGALQHVHRIEGTFDIKRHIVVLAHILSLFLSTKLSYSSKVASLVSIHPCKHVLLQKLPLLDKTLLKKSELRQKYSTRLLDAVAENSRLMPDEQLLLTFHALEETHLADRAILLIGMRIGHDCQQILPVLLEIAANCLQHSIAANKSIVPVPLSEVGSLYSQPLALIALTSLSFIAHHAKDADLQLSLLRVVFAENLLDVTAQRAIVVIFARQHFGTEQTVFSFFSFHCRALLNGSDIMHVLPVRMLSFIADALPVGALFHLLLPLLLLLASDNATVRMAAVTAIGSIATVMTDSETLKVLLKNVSKYARNIKKLLSDLQVLLATITTEKEEFIHDKLCIGRLLSCDYHSSSDSKKQQQRHSPVHQTQLVFNAVSRDVLQNSLLLLFILAEHDNDEIVGIALTKLVQTIHSVELLHKVSCWFSVCVEHRRYNTARELARYVTPLSLSISYKDTISMLLSVASLCTEEHAASLCNQLLSVVDHSVWEQLKPADRITLLSSTLNKTVRLTDQVADLCHRVCVDGHLFATCLSSLVTSDASTGPSEILPLLELSFSLAMRSEAFFKNTASCDSWYSTLVLMLQSEMSEDLYIRRLLFDMLLLVIRKTATLPSTSTLNIIVTTVTSSDTAPIAHQCRLAAISVLVACATVDISTIASFVPQVLLSMQTLAHENDLYSFSMLLQMFVALAPFMRQRNLEVQPLQLFSRVIFAVPALHCERRLSLASAIIHEIGDQHTGELLLHLVCEESNKQIKRKEKQHSSFHAQFSHRFLLAYPTTVQLNALAYFCRQGMEEKVPNMSSTSVSRLSPLLVDFVAQHLIDDSFVEAISNSIFSDAQRSAFIELHNAVIASRTTDCSTDQILSQLDQILESLVGLMSPLDFIAIMTGVLETASGALLATSLKLLTDKLSSSFSARMQPQVQESMLRTLLPCIYSLIRSVDTAHNLAIQASLMALDTVLSLLPLDNEEQREVALSGFDEILKLLADSIPETQGHALLVLSTLIRKIDVGMLQHLPSFFPHILNSLSTSHDALRLAALSAATASLTHLSKFVAPYLKTMVGKLAEVASRRQTDARLNVALKVDTFEAEDQHSELYESIAQHYSSDQIIDVLGKQYNESASVSLHSVLFLCRMLRRKCSMLSSDECKSHFKLYLRLFLKFLETRSECKLANDSPNLLLHIEAEIVHALHDMLLHLPELFLKRTVTKFVEWAADPSLPSYKSAARFIPTQQFILVMFEKLKSIFVPYYGYFLDAVQALIQRSEDIFSKSASSNNAKSNDDSEKSPSHLSREALDDDLSVHAKKKRRTSKSIVAVSSPNNVDAHMNSAKQCDLDDIASPLSCFYDMSLFNLFQDLFVRCVEQAITHDNHHIAFWSSQRYQAVLSPLLSQISLAPSGRTPKEYLDWVESRLAPCLSLLAHRCHSPELWKPLVHGVLLQTRHQKAPVRRAALIIYGALLSRLRLDLLSLLPETLPYMAELLEDADVQVEEDTRQLLRRLEEMSGESILGKQL